MTNFSSYIPAPAPKWVERFARVGLTAKGIVYCLVGILAFMAAFELGSSSQSAGKTGVFRFILEQPFGQILLAIVAIGLACYSIWRIIQAIKDTENKGDDMKGLAKRGSFLFSGLIYGALAFAAAQLVLGNSSGQGGDARQTLAQKLLEQPFGQFLLIAVGIGVIGSGLYQVYKGISEKYKKNVQKSGLGQDIESTIIKAGKVGYIARGIVWMIIGWLFIRAAMTSNSNEAGGSSSAFQFLEESSYGSFLLGAVAIGLICYGAFMFMRAKYQPVNT